MDIEFWVGVFYFFSPNTLNISLHFLLLCMVSDKKSIIIIIPVVLLDNVLFFSKDYFKITFFGFGFWSFNMIHSYICGSLGLLFNYFSFLMFSEFPGSIVCLALISQSPNHYYWRRQWQPTPVLWPGKNPMDGGAWWAAVHRVARRVGHDWATSLSLFTFMHGRRNWQPTPVFLPRESQGRQSLVGCHLWGHTESDMTEAT